MHAKHVFVPALVILTCLTISILSAQETSKEDSGSSSDSLQFAASQTVSQVIDYQGFLSSSQGEPISGSITVQFTIWDYIEDGVKMWSETQTVDVRAGYFTAQLGSFSPMPSLLFDGSPRWLQLAIGGEVLKPRKRVNSVAHSLYSVNAAQLNGLPASSYYLINSADDFTKNNIDAANLGGSSASAYLTSGQTDGRYIRKNFPNTITGSMIVDGTIQPQDLGFEPQGGGSGVSKIIPEHGLEGGGLGEVRIGLNASYQTGQAFDIRFVKKGELGSVTSAMIGDNAVASMDIKDGSIEQVDLGFPAGTINGVSAGDGLSGGGAMGTVVLALRDDYKSGAAYDAHFVVRNEQNAITSSMILNNDVASVDIRDGSILPQDLSFPAGDVTAVRGINGLDGGGQSGDVLLGLESKYISGVAYDSRFMKKNEVSSVTSQMIQNYSILQEDMAFTAGDVTAVTSSGGISGGGVSGDIHMQLDIPYQTGDAYRTLFVEEDQYDAVTSQMIRDGSVRGTEIANGVVNGDHLATNFYVQQNIAGGPVITAYNQAITANSSGVEGRGYLGVRGVGSDTGVYGEGAHYGVYAKASTPANYGLYVQGKAHCTSGAWGDLAEYVPSYENLQPGDVVVIDPLSENRIKRCDTTNDTRVAGIISTAPTITVGEETDGGDKYALALAGIVPCKVIANEPIFPGDLLTTSSKSGFAEKAVNPKIGAIVGKALQGLPSGQGVIRVLVALQ
jgi:hypothetical protein